MKSIIAAGILLASAPAAIAGPYVNVETNAGWAGTKYNGQLTDIHLGFERDLGENSDWYIQGGPALFGQPGEALERRWSAKTGMNVSLTEKVGVYGEVSVLTADKELSTDDLSLGLKAGVKYTF